MTEEIIIDGVDVAGCFYFIDHTPPKGQGDWCGAIHKGACKVYSKDCEYNPNCYYKQLKRLEQENKELKIYIESNKQQVEEIEILVMDNNRLQQEVENLKDVIYYDVEKYRSALEEIKIIADDTFKVCDDDCGNARKIKLIVDKINEVLQ